MFKPGSLEVPSPTATSHTFECGHHVEFTSNSARRSFEDSPRCPRCWSSRPTVHLKLTTTHRHYSFEHRWWTTVEADVLHTCKQGFATEDATVEAVNDSVQAILTDLHLLVPEPGIRDFLADPTLLQRFQAAIDRIFSLDVHLWVGGKWLERVGMQAGWRS